jgi:hypothetical protein
MTWATHNLASTKDSTPVCHGRPGRAIVGRHPGTADTAVAHERQHEINALTIQTDTPVDTLLLECLRRRGVVR